MVKIKNIKKFKKYNMRVENNNILLICAESQKSEKDIKDINDKRLIKSILDIGRDINNVLNEYFKKEKKEKLYSEIIQFEKLDKKEINAKIINLITKNFSVDMFKGTSINLNTDLNTPRKVINTKAFYDFYKNSYTLLEKEKIDISNLDSPNIVHDQILWEYYGIGDVNNSGKYDNMLNINFTQLIKKLDENKNNLDYLPLIDLVNFLPINIENFFGTIMENNVNNKYTHKIYDKIVSFCNEYGLPYWKDEILDRASKIKEIEIPINNFISICLAIYVYYSLWREILEYNKVDDYLEYVQAFNVLNIDFYYYDEKKDILKKVVHSIEGFDLFVNNNCSMLLNWRLEKYRKKIIVKNSILKNEIIYDSLIIGAWDLFYMTYFGNSSKLKGKETVICSFCNREILDNVHTLRDKTKNKICDSCFRERKKVLNLNRVSKYNNKIREKREC